MNFIALLIAFFSMGYTGPSFKKGEECVQYNPQDKLSLTNVCRDVCVTFEDSQAHDPVHTQI